MKLSPWKDRNKEICEINLKAGQGDSAKLDQDLIVAGKVVS